MSIEVIGIGALNLDKLYRVAKILNEGEAPVKEVILSPGGSAANTIFALAKLGIKTGFIGAVGEDEEGRILIEDLVKVGVDTQLIKVKKGKTGEVIALVDSKGRRVLYVLPGANNLLSFEDIDLNYLKQAQFLHLSSFVDEKQFALQKRLLKFLPDTVKISFSPGMLYASRGLNSLSPFLKRAYILFLNALELKMLTGMDLIEGTKRCSELGAKLIVVTSIGKKYSCFINDGQRSYRITSHYKPEVVKDTTGAGDAFAAGFLFGILKGLELERCALLGEIMAGFSITGIGARSNLPTLDELWNKYLSLMRGSY